MSQGLRGQIGENTRTQWVHGTNLLVPMGAALLKAVFFSPNIEELFAFYQDSWEQTVSFTAIATSKKKFAFYWQIHLGEGRCSGSIGRNLCVCGRFLHLSSDAFQVCFSLDDHEYFIQLKTG